MILQDRVAVVTGGSRGIGYAIAEKLASEGCSVLLVARTEKELELAKSKLISQGFSAETCAADVSSLFDVHRVRDLIGSRRGGRLDILVNAAGVYGPIGSIDTVDPQEWQMAVSINLFGTFLMMHNLVPLMKQRGRGKVINFSGGGEGAYANFSSYVSAKGGLVRLTETVAAELKDFNIDVNAIAPGAVNTGFLDDLLMAGPEKSGSEIYERALKQKEEGGVSPQKAADLVLFLVSAVSDGISGKLISAVWDDYKKFPKYRGEIMNSDVYTMKRIKPSDRGLEL